MVHLYGIDFISGDHEGNTLPRALGHSKIVAHVSSIEADIRNGDTVLVGALREWELPSFVGRVVDVRASIPSDEQHGKHPFIESLLMSRLQRHEAAQREGDYDVYIKLQLFISPSSRPEPDRSERTWPTLEDGERQFFIDLWEVAETNCYVWVHVDQIEEIVFILHYEDVKSLHHGVVWLV